MVATPTGILDLWTLFVNLMFGSFWGAVIGLALLIYFMMGFLGRTSIYSTTIFIGLFILAMTLGYGIVTLNILITLFLLVAFYFAVTGWLDRGGQ